jgi:poly [ADP-ribose] polymerase
VPVTSRKFYVLQLLQDGDDYYLFQHWGRTGTTGQVKTDEFDDEEEAIGAFEDKFKSKTGSAWADPASTTFKQKKGKYNYLAKDYDLSRDEDGNGCIYEIVHALHISIIEHRHVDFFFHCYTFMHF